MTTEKQQTLNSFRGKICYPQKKKNPENLIVSCHLSCFFNLFVNFFITSKNAKIKKKYKYTRKYNQK